ncbi:cell wall hydrolase [Phenylobacterium sp.]|uniref:cell wall hydrolase n=1 Tax=Phenylobacterium sp. TaxID=1871053 RepID=UPI002F955C2C
MISRLRNGYAVLLAGLQLVLVTLLSAGLAIAAVPAEDGQRLARMLGGDISAQAFARLTRGMDPAMLALAGRFEPKVQPVALRPAIADQSLQTAQLVSDTEAGVIRLQDLSPDAARLWNAAQPVSTLPNPAARPFFLKTEGVLDEARALDCMTAAIYYEAAYESVDGQRAVAQVVLNRMRHPAFPKSVCGVVFQGSNRTTGCQFTFTCDGALAREPNPEIWARARKIAEAALNGYVMKKVGNATHYHASYVAPYWSPSLVKVGNVGAHIFYRWTGGAGLPPAFGGRYAGGEMAGLQMATLDKLSKGPGKVMLASNTTPEVAVNESPALEVAAPAAEPVKSEPELVAAADMSAAAAKAMIKAEELDWAGRPKTKTPPRIAIPGGGASF